MDYNTETVNAQILNQAFINKLDNGMVKEAEVAASSFVRQKLREDGFARKIFQPRLIAATDLHRQTTEEPTIIVEKEPESIAASIPFHGRATPRYFASKRYPVTFSQITSDEFKKNKFELMTAGVDIPTILQENSVKDMQTEFCRTLRLNVITRNDLKIKISKILIDKINSKNNKAEFYNPKVAMKSKVRSFEELLEVVSGSIYEEMLR